MPQSPVSAFRQLRKPLPDEAARAQDEELLEIQERLREDLIRHKSKLKSKKE
jgi:hypothetical protein